MQIRRWWLYGDKILQLAAVVFSLWFVFIILTLLLLGGCTMYLSPSELELQRKVESRLGNLEGRIERVEKQIDVPVLVERPTPLPTQDPAMNWEINSGHRWPEVQP